MTSFQHPVNTISTSTFSCCFTRRRNSGHCY